jgi:hypothetical protein
LNTVYTVRSVFTSPSGVVALYLAEIHNPLVWSSGVRLEAYFLANRFRPLKKLKVEDFLSAPVDRERVPA